MRRRILAVATATAVLAAPAAAAAAKTHYRADIRRTTGGWAHVRAGDYGSLGFGYGYAYAQDQLCEMADIVVTVNAQRSRWFGPRDGNLESDFFYQRIRDERTVERLARRKAPFGPSKIVRQTVNGFVAGFNAYLRRTGRRHLPDPTCRGKGWVRTITAMDLYRRFYQLSLRASSGNFSDEIVAAAPPAGTAAAAAAPRTPDPQAFDARLGPVERGSNAYGIGRDGARGERSLVLGNPHFPWHGSERFYEVHLTIPGKLNVIGAALQGAPVVNIGFNEHVGWSHTVSSARRFTPYQLDLVPGEPTQYLVDGKAVGMRARTVKVRVRGGATRRHTFYETRWGPVFSFTQAGLTWGTDHAYALADVNADNFRLVNQWAEYDRARSVRGLRRAYRPCRATRGSTRSRPMRRAAPTTPTSRWSPTSTPTCRAAARRRTRSRRCCSARAWSCSTARGRPAPGSATPTRSCRASSGRGSCRAARAPTTWRIPTTPTGCPARASGSPATRASSAARRPSARCARGSH
jgi:acyl-homoserine-lactone acylase